MTAGAGQLTDGLVGQVAEVVRPVRPGGHGQARERLEACRADIEAWVEQGLTVRPRPGRIPAPQRPAHPHRRRGGEHPVTTAMRDIVSADLRTTLRALKLGAGKALPLLNDRDVAFYQTID